ncbi:putative MFS transporter [Sporomusaceae bacterium BoRhaA]|uniref:MFS transporter n=1 Tax=Pelorhabdus rhamnosifermentans TaxID=2772457 RepID=UPI001C062E7F|nr:MFS transporter [Pelorhabdus rhamnosifermentans]MBU2699631.1 putative MFS transporter [Pelorhabdus rhamnosifermentans]
MNVQGNTVGSIIEKISLSRTHYHILIIAALGFLFDSFDTYIVSYAMPLIRQEWQINPVINGMLASAGTWGMFLGAMLWGPISDRYGRKIGFIGTILGFGLITGLTALSQSPFEFGLFRFFTGMCIGGAIPVTTALVSEYAAARYRGRFVSMLTLLWPFGLLLAAFASLHLVTEHGWRILFILGTIPALLAIVAGFKLPESPRWLATQGRASDARRVLIKLGAKEEDVSNLADEKLAEKVPIGVLLTPMYRKRFLLTAGYYFFGYFGYYGFAMWIPTILATVYGLSLAKTFTFGLIGAAGAILARATAFYTVEKFGRKQLFYVGYGLGGVAALLFGLLKDPAYAMVGVFVIFYLCEQGGAGTVVYTAELYPSKVRATATAWSTGAGRISSATSPILFGYLMANHMYYGVFIAMALFMWIAVALVFFLGVETKGKSLEDVGAA